MDTAQTHDAPRPKRRRRLLKFLLIALLTFMVFCMTVWASLFLYLSPLPNSALRSALAIAFAVGTLASFIIFRKRWRALLAYLVVFAALVTWYYSIPPRLDRDWSPEVARLPTATVNGDLVTITNIRNLDYRSETDFTPRYYDKTFDLSKLQSTDFICVFWGSPAVAHVMASFGFGGDDYVTFSIEMRAEKGEPHSLLESFFRKFELIYVVADERDVIRVRTDFRNPREQVYIYRTRLPIENQRKLFLSYVSKVDSLSHTPEWYNTLEDNCTTGVLQRIHQSYKGRARYNWKILLPGYVGEYAYDCGMLDSSMPFAELRERCLVNAKAQAAGDAPDFSKRIREGLPMPAPYTMQEFLSGK